MFESKAIFSVDLNYLIGLKLHPIIYFLLLFWSSVKGPSLPSFLEWQRFSCDRLLLTCQSSRSNRAGGGGVGAADRHAPQSGLQPTRLLPRRCRFQRAPGLLWGRVDVLEDENLSGSPSAFPQLLLQLLWRKRGRLISVRITRVLH